MRTAGVRRCTEVEARLSEACPRGHELYKHRERSQKYRFDLQGDLIGYDKFPKRERIECTGD